MPQTTIQTKNDSFDIISHYCLQYQNNYSCLNMEFMEFMASKLEVSESDAVKAIRNWKQTLILKTENK